MADRRTTTQRGLGNEHQKRRRLTPKPNGDPCPFCGAAMFADMALDFDHAIPRALGGTAATGRWAHRRCNRRAGAKLGNAMRARRGVRSRDW